MSTHNPGKTEEADNREHQGPIAKAISKVVGSAHGDKTDPGGPRGWEQPLEEMQAPSDGEPSANAD